MQKKFLPSLKRTVACILVLCVAFSTAGCKGKSDAQKKILKSKEYKAVKNEEYDSRIKSSEETVLVADDGNFELYADGKEAVMCLKDKNTGNEWYTNPKDRKSDPLAVGVNLNFLNSQIIVEYVESGKKAKADSFSQSIEIGQYDFYPIENGIGVNYLIGKKPKIYIVPKALTEKRFKEIKKKIKNEDDLYTFESYFKKIAIGDLKNEADKALFLKAFPILEKHPIYFFNSTGTVGFEDPSQQTASDFFMEQVEAVFVNIGYTLEDMHADNKENEVNIVEKPDYSVTVSLEYRLENGALNVTVPNGSITYDKKTMQLQNIWINPYFGAADNTKEGYMLVPSGSGALINLNNGKTNLQPYTSELIYGEDPLFEVPPKEQKTGIKPHFPVFGMKQNDTGFLGIIEDGDASAFIEADISGRTDSYNHICPKFQIARPQHQDTVIMNLTDFDIYSDIDLNCDLKIRYIPLQGNQADYSGMANAYRNYLKQSLGISPVKTDNSISLNLRVLGAVTYKRSFLGIPVNSPKVLTSYTETAEILKEFKKNNVKDTVLELSDWANGGRENTVYNKVKLMPLLGGKKDFNRLVQYTEQNSVSFYPSVDVQSVRKDKSFDGFNAKKDAARTLNKKIAYNYDYKLTTFEKIKDSSSTVISPALYSELLSSSIADLDKLGIENFSINKLGTVLTSDYNTKYPMDRQLSRNTVIKNLKELPEKSSILVRAANAYALEKAAFITDVPTNSENHYMFDRSVPFYQIVLHGLIPMASEPLNYADSFEDECLKLIETGVSPSFEFIYRDNYELKDTKYNIYGVNYKLWIKQASAVYSEMSEALKDCQNAEIVSHSQLADGINRTVYSNGAEFIVNHSNSDFVYEGKTVAAKSYIRSEGR